MQTWILSSRLNRRAANESMFQTTKKSYILKCPFPCLDGAKCSKAWRIQADPLEKISWDLNEDEGYPSLPYRYYEEGIPLHNRGTGLTKAGKAWVTRMKAHIDREHGFGAEPYNNEAVLEEYTQLNNLFLRWVSSPYYFWTVKICRGIQILTFSYSNLFCSQRTSSGGIAHRGGVQPRSTRNSHP